MKNSNTILFVSESINFKSGSACEIEVIDLTKDDANDDDCVIIETSVRNIGECKLNSNFMVVSHKANEVRQCLPQQYDMVKDSHRNNVQKICNPVVRCGFQNTLPQEIPGKSIKCELNKLQSLCEDKSGSIRHIFNLDNKSTDGSQEQKNKISNYQKPGVNLVKKSKRIGNQPDKQSQTNLKMADQSKHVKYSDNSRKEHVKHSFKLSNKSTPNFKYTYPKSSSVGRKKKLFSTPQEQFGSVTLLNYFEPLNIGEEKTALLGYSQGTNILEVSQASKENTNVELEQINNQFKSLKNEEIFQNSEKSCLSSSGCERKVIFENKEKPFINPDTSNTLIQKCCKESKNECNLSKSSYIRITSNTNDVLPKAHKRNISPTVEKVLPRKKRRTHFKQEMKEHLCNESHKSRNPGCLSVMRNREVKKEVVKDFRHSQKTFHKSPIECISHTIEQRNGEKKLLGDVMSVSSGYKHSTECNITENESKCLAVVEAMLKMNSSGNKISPVDSEPQFCGTSTLTDNESCENQNLQKESFGELDLSQNCSQIIVDESQDVNCSRLNLEKISQVPPGKLEVEKSISTEVSADFSFCKELHKATITKPLFCGTSTLTDIESCENQNLQKESFGELYLSQNCSQIIVDESQEVNCSRLNLEKISQVPPGKLEVEKSISTEVSADFSSCKELHKATITKPLFCGTSTLTDIESCENQNLQKESFGELDQSQNCSQIIVDESQTINCSRLNLEKISQVPPGKLEVEKSISIEVSADFSSCKELHKATITKPLFCGTSTLTDIEFCENQNLQKESFGESDQSQTCSQIIEDESKTINCSRKKITINTLVSTLKKIFSEQFCQPWLLFDTSGIPSCCSTKPYDDLNIFNILSNFINMINLDLPMLAVAHFAEYIFSDGVPDAVSVQRIFQLMLETDRVDVLYAVQSTIISLLGYYPPCFVHSASYYREIFANQSSKNSPLPEGLIHYLLNQLSQESENSKDENFLSPCVNKPLFLGTSTSSEPAGDSSNENLRPEKRVARILLILSNVRYSLASDFSNWIFKYALDPKYNITKMPTQPLIATAIWPRSAYYPVGAVKGVICLLVKCCVKLWSFKNLAVSDKSVLIEILHMAAEVVRYSVPIMENDYPFFGPACDALANKVCYQLNLYELDEKTKEHFLHALKPDWLAMKVGSLLIAEIINSAPPQVLSTMVSFVEEHYFLHKSGGLIEPCPNKFLNDTANTTKYVNVNKLDGKGEVMLHVACRKGNIEKVKSLLNDPHIRVNAQDYAGWTPLQEAIVKNRIECIKALLDYDPPNGERVDTSLGNFIEGITPLMKAALYNNLLVCKMLLKNSGPSLLKQKDKNGKTVFDYTQCQELKNFLLDAELKYKHVKKRPIMNLSKQSWEKLEPLLSLTIFKYLITFKIMEVTETLKSKEDSNLNSINGQEKSNSGSLNMNVNTYLFKQDYTAYRALKKLTKIDDTKGDVILDKLRESILWYLMHVIDNLELNY